MPSLYDELLIALHGVWNRRWLALCVAWAVCALGWLAVSLIPNAYESKAKVYVATQSVIQDKIGISSVEQQKNLDAIRQTLGSADNLIKIVRGTDLAGTVANDADIAARAASLKDRIAIVSTEDNLFEISTTMAVSGNSDRTNAKLANQITQKLLDIFQQENITGNRDETKQGLAFLDQQIADTGKALAEAEKKRVEFNQQFAGILPGAGSISDRMVAAQTELNQIESQLMGAQSALAAMNGQLAGTPSTIAGGGGGSPSALAQAQGELATAKARGWTDNHPDVVALKRQIAALKAAGGSAASGGGTPNPAYLSIKSMQAERAAAVQALVGRKAQIESDLAAVTARQIADPGLASEGERLDRDYDVLKAQYDKLLSDRGDVRMRGDVQSETKGASFRIIDPPSMPSAPASPNRPLLLVGVLIVGIGAGVGAAFLFGQVRPTFPTAARLAVASGLPVLGTVTETLNAAQIEARKHRLKIFAGASGALGAACLLLIVVEFIQRGLA
jgi:polysaccharide chain length determinant protein (PEP-CTERM system associated)